MFLKVNPVEIANFVANKFEKKVGKLVDFVRDTVDQKVDSVDQKVDSVDQKVDFVRDSVDQKVESVDKKLDSVFSIEKKLGKMLKEFIGRFKNADFQSHAKYIEPHPENFQIQRHY
jgi:uncharacterized protein YoxC